MEIRTYRDEEREGVIALVLHCQNDEFHLGLTLEDQPDLLRVREEYLDAGGCFWVAREAGEVVGTIGLVPCGDGVAILKKFFVRERFRGAPRHLGQRLFAELLAFARERGMTRVLLDTPRSTVRAHRFYERAGFRQVKQQDLAVAYAAPYADSDFFLLELA